MTCWRQSYDMKEYATHCGKLPWQTSKVTNTCNNLEHQVLVTVRRQKMKRVGENGRTMKNLLRTFEKLLFTFTAFAMYDMGIRYKDYNSINKIQKSVKVSLFGDFFMLFSSGWNIDAETKLCYKITHIFCIYSIFSINTKGDFYILIPNGITLSFTSENVLILHSIT